MVTFKLKLGSYVITLSIEKERPGYIFEDKGGKFILVTKRAVPEGESFGSWADEIFYPNSQYFEKVYLDELKNLPEDHFVRKAVERAKKERGWDIEGLASE